MDEALAGIRKLAQQALQENSSDPASACAAVSAGPGFREVCQQLSDPGVPGCCKDSARGTSALERGSEHARAEEWKSGQDALNTALKWAPEGQCRDQAFVARALCLLAQVMVQILHTHLAA